VKGIQQRRIHKRGMFSEGEYERGECSVSGIRKKNVKKLVYFQRLKEGIRKEKHWKRGR